MKSIVAVTTPNPHSTVSFIFYFFFWKTRPGFHSVHLVPKPQHQQHLALALQPPPPPPHPDSAVSPEPHCMGHLPALIMTRSSNICVVGWDAPIKPLVTPVWDCLIHLCGRHQGWGLCSATLRLKQIEKQVEHSRFPEFFYRKHLWMSPTQWKRNLQMGLTNRALSGVRLWLGTARDDWSE